MRGRILALGAVAFLGTTPIGSPITGWVADNISAEWSLAYGSVSALACARRRRRGAPSQRRSHDDDRRLALPAVRPLTGGADSPTVAADQHPADRRDTTDRLVGTARAVSRAEMRSDGCDRALMRHRGDARRH